MASQVSKVDWLTRTAVMLRRSKWNLLYVVVSVLGLLLSLVERQSDSKQRSACYAFCLLDVSIRYRAMHRLASIFLTALFTLRFCC